MDELFVSHEQAEEALGKLVGAGPKTSDTVTATNDLTRYIQEREWLEDWLMSALDNAQRTLERF